MHPRSGRARPGKASQPAGRSTQTRILGNYRLEALLGRGGMAEVFRATAVAGPHARRVVAVKQILPALAKSPAALALFEREAEITRALTHPNIIEILDVGIDAGAPYIAMDYIKGCDLKELLEACVARDIFMPIDFACYVVRTIAEALAFAHAAEDSHGKPLGIVHRDVGPSNVFISDLGEIKLGDFGVAYLGAKADTLNMMAGKAHYQAPELFQGGNPTPSVDLFALGAILYEMLTNQLAYDGASVREVYDAILDGKVEKPSALRPQISPTLEAFVLKAISPRPPEAATSGPLGRLKQLWGSRHPPRYADARAFARDLDALFDPSIGTQLAIAAVVRGLLADPP